jgi:GNAT superfamily N-acetyltransferase
MAILVRGQPTPTPTDDLRVPSRHAEDCDVTIGPVRAMRLFMVLVLAFADNKRGPVSSAGLMRGMSTQFSYRWAAGQVLADTDDHAVLLWSRLTPELGWRTRARAIVSVILSAIVDLVWSAIYSGPIALLVNGAARIGHHRLNSLPDVAVVVVVIRSADAIDRGKRSYQYHRSVVGGLPPAAIRRWCIDYLAALPAGHGHGGRLLTTFLARADTLTVEVVLHCATRNIAFYQRHGFHLICNSPSGDQHIMTRPPRMPRRPWVSDQHAFLDSLKADVHAPHQAARA